MTITIKQLEVFAAIARTENMTQAAATLHLTQSACSMALSSMETQLGGDLFDRHGKKLILNERGRVLFPKAANVITQIHEMQNLMISKTETKLAGEFVVGASTTIGNYLLPGLIGKYKDLHPQIKITMKIANTEQIIQKLLKFEIDIGMIEGNCYSDDIEVIPWKKDALIIICAPQYALAAKRKPTLQDLHSAKWILRESGSGTREKFEEAMNGKVQPFLEFGNTEAIKQAVLAGVGISCISRSAVSDLIKAGQLVELKTPYLNLIRDFYIILHKEKYKTDVLNSFIKCLSLP